MCRLYLLTLVVAALQFTGRFAFEYDAGSILDGTTPNGIRYKTLDGFKTTSCGDACQGAVYMTPSAMNCAVACANDVACSSVLYRLTDGYCSFKNEAADSSQLGLESDDTSPFIAISIERSDGTTPPTDPSPSPSPSPSSSPSPSPQPSPQPSPSPDYIEPSPSPSPKPASSSDPSPMPSPTPSPMPSPTPSPTPSPAPSPAPTPVPSSPTPTPSPAPTPTINPIPRDNGSGGAGGAGGPEGPLAEHGDFSGLVGVRHRSMMTRFDGFGEPYGGCGVPMDDMRDDNGKILPFIAFNRYTTDPNVLSMFQEGANCGRWLKVTVHYPCGGSNDGQAKDIPGCLENWDVIASGDSPSGHEGKVIYGYVADSCQDTNGWCRDDQFHVDMGVDNMESNGLLTDWRNNRIEWEFLPSTPAGFSQRQPQFRWCKDAKIEWLCLIIVKVNNGISKLEVKMDDGSWEQGVKVYILGQMFNLPPSTHIAVTGGQYTVRAFDYAGQPYGEFNVNPPAGVAEVTDAQ